MNTAAERTGKIAGRILLHLGFLLLGFIMLYPVLWMIACSFKSNTEIFGNASLIPRQFLLDNYIRGWKYIGSITFTTFFLNSLFYVVLATIGTVLSSALVAFGFARVRFRGRNAWFAVMFVTMILPYQVIMIPQFIIFQKLGLVNTFVPLVLPMFLGQPFFIFLMVQFVRGIPMELDESAVIDGCRSFGIFTRIIFPLITPAVVTTAIFSFYWRWNDFLGPLLYLNKTRLYTVSLALRLFSDPMTSTDWGAIFAMCTVSLAPILVVFVVFQRYITEGISTTGLKT